MRFSKPPQLLSADDLAGFVRSLINDRWPESDALDYKATLNYSRPRDRIELAKDISSFANEIGGTVVYGVPEAMGQEEAPLPAPLNQCGMDLNPGMLETVENILLNAINPVLPNLFVKSVSLAEIEPKKLVVIHHPASWNKPHMVELYGHRRFYRRGNYRATPMSEREVEAAYALRRSHHVAAEDFFKTADLGGIPANGRYFHVVTFPVQGIVRREKMREDAFKKWVEENPPAGRRGSWVPFLDGVRFLSYATGALNGHQFELRLFHNSALSFTADMADMIVDDSINLGEARKVMELYSLIPAAKAAEFLGIAGPLAIKVVLRGAVGLKAFFRADRAAWYADPARGPSALYLDPTTFSEESTVDELLGQPDQLLSRLVDRLASAFGMWRVT